MKKLYSLVSQERYFSYIISFFAIIVLGIVVYTLNKGIMWDEAWYLFLTKDKPDGMVTQFYYYLPDIFGIDLLCNRVAMFIVDVISSVVFSLGLYFYFRAKLNLNKYSLVAIISLSIIGLYIGHIPVNYVFSYVTMNRVAMLFSLGLLLLSLSVHNSYVSKICTIFSGLFGGMLIFIMITNIPMLLLVVLLLCLRKKTRTLCLYYVGGVLLSVILFFVFCLSFDGFLSLFNKYFGLTVADKVDSSHGISFLIKWLIGTVVYFSVIVFAAFLFIEGSKTVLSSKGNKPAVLWILRICVLFCCIYFGYKYVLMEPRHIVDKLPLYAFFFYLLYNNLISKESVTSDVWMILLIFSTTICLSCGSDMPYSLRSTNYLVFCVPLLFILVKYVADNQKQFCVLLIVVFCYMIPFLIAPMRTNWAMIKYKQQSTPVSSININQKIKVDAIHIDELKTLDELGMRNQIVLVASKFLWQYCYLLDCHPVDYNFYFNHDAALQSINNCSDSIQSLYIVKEVEDDNADGDFITLAGNVFTAKQVEKIENSRFCVYILRR